MVIFGMILWSIFGIYGTKLLIDNIFNIGKEDCSSKVKFSPEQIGGLVMLPLGGIVTLILALLVDNNIIDLKWDR